MRYWTSLFLGHTRCDDLVAAFHNGLNELEETNMIQISMNGPNTNLKLLSEVQNERQKKTNFHDSLTLGHATCT